MSPFYVKEGNAKNPPNNTLCVLGIKFKSHTLLGGFTQGKHEETHIYCWFYRWIPKRDGGVAISDLLPSGYTNQTAVNTSNFVPPSRILERNSKENIYLPSKTPLVYACTLKGDHGTHKALTPCLRAPQPSGTTFSPFFLVPTNKSLSLAFTHTHRESNLNHTLC